MPCYKCSNGKWKYGLHGNCQFDTEEQCHKAEIAILIGKKSEDCNCGDKMNLAKKPDMPMDPNNMPMDPKKKPKKKPKKPENNY